MELEEAALLGDDVKKLLGGKIGDYLIKRATDEMEVGLRELRTVDSTDSHAILTIQLRIEQREKFLVWLGDAVHEGENALQTLALMESED